MRTDPEGLFLERVREAVLEGTLVKLTLGAPREGAATWRQVYVRPVQLRAGRRLSFCYRYPTQDITKNDEPEAALERLRELLGQGLRSAHLFTVQDSFELQASVRGKPRLIRRGPQGGAEPSLAHDRVRTRLVAPGAPWLETLGVTDGAGQVREGRAAKFRQIHRFVEILAHQLAARRGPAGSGLRLVDMGCGKGYLTFAAFDWLRGAGYAPLEVVGVEARDDLVVAANQAAVAHGKEGLRFERGSIAETALDRVDVLVALHACDTATDDALAKGIRAGAGLILVAPCCHRELRPQMRPPAALAGAWRHGILRERQAEWVTDALRAALLEWAGYTTRVFEFISTEHTAKNLMIAAVRRSAEAEAGPRPEVEDAADDPGQPGGGEAAEAAVGGKGSDARAAAVRALAGFYGIRSQRLAQQLGWALTGESAQGSTMR